MAHITNVLINGTSVNFQYGIVIKDLLNKDLNTGVLVIPSTTKLDIEPMDIVTIYYEDGFRKLYVATVNEKLLIHKDTKYYDYELGLVSLSIKLQRIVLPNRVITQSLDGLNDKTIIQVLKEYRDTYAPEMVISPLLEYKLGDKICPEMQWQRPTLFEVFNDLLISIGCVVSVIDENIIDFLDLYEEGSAIDETKLSEINTTQDIREYATAFEVNASNVYSKQSITRTPERYITHTIRQAILTSSNQQLIVQKPIFEIVKLEATFLTYNLEAEYRRKTVDISKRVVSRDFYATLYESNAVGRILDTAEKKYRRNYLYFEEGSNVIDGIDFQEADWLPFSDSKQALYNAIYNTVYENEGIDEANRLQEGLLTGLVHDDIYFYIEYRTTEDVLFRVRKNNAPRHESILINGQTNPIVYADLLGKQQQEFVDRTGNKQMIISGRYEFYDEIPNLKDYIGDFILTEREISIENDYYLVKAVLNEHYSMENMFAGINTKKRYTEITRPNEAVKSNHISEKFLKMTTSGTLSETEYLKLFSDIGRDTKYLQGAIVQTRWLNDSDVYEYSPLLMLELTPYAIGRSIVITMNMQDNYNVALRFDDDYNDGTGVQSMQTVKYVNDLGRFDDIKIKLYEYDKDKEQRGFENWQIDEGMPNMNSLYYNVFKWSKWTARKYPIVETTMETMNYDESNQQYFITRNFINENAMIYETDWLKRFKDTRETTYETIQFQFVVEGSDLFVKDLFYKMTALMYNESADYDFKIYYSKTSVYAENETKGKGTLASNAVLQTSGNANTIYVVDIVGYDTWETNKSTMISWSICDQNDNIIIAVNGNGSKKIYIEEGE